MRWKIWYALCSKFHTLSSGEKNWKSVQIWQKRVDFGTQCNFPIPDMNYEPDIDGVKCWEYVMNTLFLQLRVGIWRIRSYKRRAASQRQLGFLLWFVPKRHKFSEINNVQRHKRTASSVFALQVVIRFLNSRQVGYIYTFIHHSGRQILLTSLLYREHQKANWAPSVHYDSYTVYFK